MPDRRPFSLLLVAPALTLVLALFVYPLCYSLVSAFTARDGEPSLDNFAKTSNFPGALPKIDFKGLAIVAFVQDDSDKRILHTVQASVPDAK